DDAADVVGLEDLGGRDDDVIAGGRLRRHSRSSSNPGSVEQQRVVEPGKIGSRARLFKPAPGARPARNERGSNRRGRGGSQRNTGIGRRRVSVQPAFPALLAGTFEVRARGGRGPCRISPPSSASSAFRIDVGRCSAYFVPVWPKPPAPRADSVNSSTTSNSAATTGTKIICAMRSPGLTVKAAVPRFHSETYNCP